MINKKFKDIEEKKLDIFVLNIKFDNNPSKKQKQ